MSGTDILMPALSPTMEEGTLAKWLVAVGDTVKAGDVIAEIETDKATMEVEAVDEGVVSELLVAAGSEGVKVNAVIARLGGEGGSAAPAPAPKTEAAPADSTGEPEKKPATESAAAAPKPVAAPVGDDPEIPAGTNLVKISLRDALRDAMAEEMRRDDKVFLMGEEVA